MVRQQESGKWQDRIGWVISGYRLVAFAIGSAQLLVMPQVETNRVPTLAIIIGVGAYTLVKAIIPVRLHVHETLNYLEILIDLGVCAFLVTSTGGLSSPFLTYSFAPVLISALFLSGRVTFLAGSISILYLVLSERHNPFFSTPLLSMHLIYFLPYTMSVFLVAILPYLINFNVRRRLRQENVLRERQRLSRELHDGIAQTAIALRWQVQLLRRRLQEKGINLDESAELERLAEKAQQDARESLELLRIQPGNGGFLSQLKDDLQRLKLNDNVNVSLDVEKHDFRLEPNTEVELIRICQESLANIRRHAEAKNVKIAIREAGGYLKVAVRDDGRGFDAIAFYQNNGKESKWHGLAVMQERAQSIGGKLRVLSQPGHGTEIEIDVPVSRRVRRWQW